MKLKKLGAVALSAIAIMTPCATTVSAEETKSGDTTVTYTQVDSGSWEWTIPGQSGETSSAIDLTNGAQTGELKVTDASIPANRKIDVTASGDGTDGAFIMQTSDKTKSYGFSLSYTENSETKSVTPKTTILLSYAAADSGEKSTTVTFTPDSTKPAVGEYSGKVTFTSTLKEAE